VNRPEECDLAEVREEDATSGLDRLRAGAEELIFLRRWLAKKYALSAIEMRGVLELGRLDLLEECLEAWREGIGLPPHNSPLTRGKLIELVQSGKFR
jgi:hypothetical protein